MQAPDPPLCAGCGYDLSGTPIIEHNLTCPECGGNRVKLPRWYEPRTTRLAGLVYMPGCLLACVPPALVMRLMLPDGGMAYWLLGACPPFLWLGLVLVPWRPSPRAGVTVICLVAGCATGLGLLIASALRLLGDAAMLWAVPLGFAYYILTVPLGILWAQAILDDTSERGVGV